MQSILRRKQVSALTGLSRSTIYKFISEGKFPKQVNLGGARAVGWLSSEIQSWVDTRPKVKSNSSHD
jgi:prophage regulatory protein